ncbi:hypothetical protein GCM10011531_15290 [Aquaticitalea lipolytica]|uniref:SH3 domain-containing protein n=1 Tax=Aquaticitalea lipolytica TaxID=1247562 RepID=A0A8J2TP17_9FLAO|nr:hypothetical protein [Aquaticitalea lipolytica]GFZ85179.1 hypothetical protein GCM10011531_15290 [Aquaticitalea lipolytica]
MRTILVLLLSSLNLIAQDNDKIHYLDFVESYYSKETETPILIYDAINGKVVDSLYNVPSKYSWYKIAIIESEYGWFKIKNIQRLPDSYKNYNYENYWVKTSNFLISVDIFGENHIVYLYDEPTKKSNRIHKIDNFQQVNVIETKDLWSMVSFMVGKKKVTGWLSFKDQCAYPWTTCPKYD